MTCRSAVRLKIDISEALSLSCVWTLRAIDRHTRAGRDSCFQRTQCNFLACTVGDEQNVVALQRNILPLAGQDCFQVNRDLGSLIRSRSHPQYLRMFCVWSLAESFRHRDGL